MVIVLTPRMFAVQRFGFVEEGCGAGAIGICVAPVCRPNGGAWLSHWLTHCTPSGQDDKCLTAHELGNGCP